MCTRPIVSRWRTRCVKMCPLRSVSMSTGKSATITQCSEVPKQICKVHHKRVPVRVSKNVPKKVCHVPSHAVHTVPIHTVHNVHEFVPAPAPAPAPVLPVLSVTTPSALDDILNRN